MSVLDIAVLNWILAAIGIGSTAVAIWFYFRPGMRRASAVADAILGEAEEKDRSGNLVTPARPGLVHRVATVEDAVVEFRHAIGVYTEVLGRLDSVERDVKYLKDRRVENIVTAAERAATAATSAEMLRMVHERDTTDADADELAGDLQSPAEGDDRA